MQLPQIICRSIDIMLKNDDERVQALKLVKKNNKAYTMYGLNMLLIIFLDTKDASNLARKY